MTRSIEALFGTVGEKRAALIRVSSSEAAFPILARVVLFAAFCVVSGRRTRVAFGGIFSCFSLIRDACGLKQGLTVPGLSRNSYYPTPINKLTCVSFEFDALIV